MKKIKAIFLVLAMIYMTGCWDSIEVGNLAIVTGLGIDTGPKNGEIRLVLQVGDMNKNDQGGGESKPIILDSSGVSIQACIEELKTQSSRNLYFSHNQAILIGEQQAKDGIGCFMDWFIRNENTRMEVPIIVAKEDAKKVLQTKTEQDKISAFAIKHMIENQTSAKFYTKINLLSFLSGYMDKTTAPICPIITAQSDSDGEQIIHMTGIAIFKEGKMKGELNVEQTDGLMWVLGQYKKHNIIVTDEMGSASLSIINSKSEIDCFMENDVLTNTVKIKSTFRISELTGFKEEELKNIVEIIEEAVRVDINARIESVLQSSRNYECDIFGFGSAFYRNDQKEFEKIFANWNEMYKNSQYRIDLDIKVIDSGKTGSIIGKERAENLDPSQ